MTDIAEIENQLKAALGDNATALQLRQVHRAAQLELLAARARDEALSGGAVDLAEISKLEDMAASAVAAIGLPEQPAVTGIEVKLVNNWDMKKLTDAELDALEVLALKAGGRPETAVPPSAEWKKETDEIARRNAALDAEQRRREDGLRRDLEQLRQLYSGAVREIEALKGRPALSEAAGDGRAPGVPHTNVVPLQPSARPAAVVEAEREELNRLRRQAAEQAAPIRGGQTTNLLRIAPPVCGESFRRFDHPGSGPDTI